MGLQSHMIEFLEERRLLSASILIKDGTLIVRGTQRADHIVVSEHRADGSIPEDGPALFVRINGRERRLDPSKIKRILVEAGNGDDHVEMTDDPFFTGLRVAQVIIEQTRPTTILGGRGNDTLIGGEAADSISGGDGNDMLAGAIGDDIVDGDNGKDTIEGNAGSDLLRGGNGHDRIFADDVGDSVQGGRGFDLLLSPHSNPASQSGFEAITAATLDTLPEFGYARGILTIFGTRRADEISLNAAFGSNPPSFGFHVNDRIVYGIAQALISKVVVLAGAGDDSVRVGPEADGPAFTPEFDPFNLPLQVDGDFGNDTIIGGWGDDTLNGGQDDDEIAGALGNDVINGGIGNDTIRGNDGNDAIVGRDGVDSIDGGAGNDTVIGDDGNDVIFGGPGADHFESPTDNSSEWKDKDTTDVVDPAPPQAILV
jgi:Ca2+-binding RTX toxin-like protein